MWSNLEELKTLIAKKLSIDEFFDVLGYDMFDVVEDYSDIIAENLEDFEDACR